MTKPKRELHTLKEEGSESEKGDPK
jgi:hypothetical protein